MGGMVTCFELNRREVREARMGPDVVVMTAPTSMTTRASARQKAQSDLEPITRHGHVANTRSHHGSSIFARGKWP